MRILMIFMRTRLGRLCASLVILVSCVVDVPAPLPGAEPNAVTAIHPPEVALVKSPQTQVMAGDERASTLPLGTQITATYSRGPWRYSPEAKGWVHSADLVLLTAAVQQFTEEIQRQPSAQAYHLRGIAWMSRGDYLKAARDLEEAYDLGESAVSLHHNLGLCYVELGQEAAALKEFDSILASYPEEARTQLERGRLLLKQGNHAGAERDFQQSAQTDGTLPDVHNLHGISLRMLGRFDEAIAAYTRAIEADPQDAESFSNRAYARKSRGDDTGALEDNEAALRLKPDSAAIQNDLAWLLATSPEASVRQPQRAVELAEAAWKDTGKRQPEFADTLAAAYARAGRFDAAIEAAALAVTLLGDQSSAEAVRERLELYRKQTSFTEARPLKPADPSGK